MGEIVFHYNEKVKNAENRIYKETVDVLLKKNGLSLTLSTNGEAPKLGGVNIGISSDKRYIKNCIGFPGICYLSVVDLHSIDLIKRYSTIFDGYLVPTPSHRDVLTLLTNKPVDVFYEAIDPIYPKNCSKNEYITKKIAWFGYPESYKKSMLNLVNVLDKSDFELLIITGNNHGEIKSPKKSKFIEFDEKTISEILNKTKLVVLSHAPIDLSLNTYIKSPNKLYSSVASGALPLCSRTPAYIATMNDLGLGRFMFSNPMELGVILTNLQKEDLNKLIAESQSKLLDLNLANMEKNYKLLRKLERQGNMRTDCFDTIDLKFIRHPPPFKVALRELLIATGILRLK